MDRFSAALPSNVPTNASLVLAYHNVVGSAELGRGDASLHLSVDAFREQLRMARNTADVVDLPCLLAGLSSPGRRIAVTFDDAYLGCLTLGLAACAEQGVVPTVFVAPALYGRQPLWDRAAAAGRWSASDRERFLWKDGGRECRAMPLPASTALPDAYRIATLDEVHGSVERHDFHLGNHTLNHLNLAAADLPTLREELGGGCAHLVQFGDRALPVLAFPYGMAPSESQRSELSAWCSAAFRVEGDWCRADDAIDRLSLPRLNVPAGLSKTGFRARLNGR